MSFPRPTLTELRQQTLAAFQARIDGADTLLRRSMLKIVAYVFAGLVNGLYGFLDYLSTLFLPDRCPAPFLTRWANIFKKPQNAATFATGVAPFTGTATYSVPVGTLLQSTAGAQYETDAAATVGGDGTVSVGITAITPGSVGNQPIGATLTLVNAIAGINAMVTLAVAIAGGADAEALEDWRARVLARIQDPPQGGNSNDYEQWAKEVSGVTRAWVYPRNRGAGTVDVCFVMDGRDNIIPLDADVAEVQAYIEGVRPVTDDFIAFKPNAQALNLTLSALTPDTAATRAAITAAWRDLIIKAAIPGGGLSFQDQIIPAVAASEGLVGFVVSSPSADVVGIAGTIFTPGTVTFP